MTIIGRRQTTGHANPAIERHCGIDALWEDCVDVDFSDAEDFGGAEDWQSLSADQSNWSETTGERDAWPEES